MQEHNDDGPLKAGRDNSSRPAPETPADAGRPFSAIGATRMLMRTARTGALGTLTPDTGAPFVSLVTTATDPAGAPLLLLSDLAVHTRNIRNDDRVSLLVEEAHPDDPLAGSRATIVGRLTMLSEEPERDAARRRFLAKHHEASFYAGFGDFAFYRLDVDTVHLVAGFGRIVDMAAGDYLLDCSECDELLAAAEGAVEHMNEDHADALALYATALVGAPPGEWQATGLDPEGLDLRAGDLTCRLLFPETLRGPGPLRAVLKRLADEAREGAAHS
ncbi:MAG: DUF2470 domain-containing protein [Pseudomonadota bacterium]